MNMCLKPNPCYSPPSYSLQLVQELRLAELEVRQQRGAQSLEHRAPGIRRHAGGGEETIEGLQHGLRVGRDQEGGKGGSEGGKGEEPSSGSIKAEV